QGRDLIVEPESYPPPGHLDPGEKGAFLRGHEPGVLVHHLRNAAAVTFGAVGMRRHIGAIAEAAIAMKNWGIPAVLVLAGGLCQLLFPFAFRPPMEAVFLAPAVAAGADLKSAELGDVA